MNYDTVLYALRFTSKRTGETFLKVGVSRCVERRFEADSARFDIESVKRGRIYCRKDAYLLESSVHKILVEYRYSPKMRLISGNTECYKDCPEVLERIKVLLHREPGLLRIPKKRTQRIIVPIDIRRDQHDYIEDRWIPTNVRLARQNTEEREPTRRKYRKHLKVAGGQDWGMPAFRHFG